LRFSARLHTLETPFRSPEMIVRSRTPARRPSRRPSGPAWWRPLGLAAHAAEVGAWRVHWVEAGAGDETVVLLHGLSGSARWWQRNIPALSAARRVLVPDLIGFGRSRVRGARLPDLPTLAEALAAWIDSAAGGPVHLVGHSMGGHLAIHLAAEHPSLVRRLVLVDAAGIPPRIGARSILRLAYEAAPPRRWGDPRFLPVIWTDAVLTGPATVVRGLVHILRDDVRPLLPQIQAPTLVVWGARDGLIPPADGRALRDGIAGARLLVIDRAYHNPMIDRPREFDAAVLRFLDGGEVGG
jgi:pimeloyl-ACP methyl ester carboxylesterase